MLDQDPGRLASVRAYYVGHLGKYLPGKAWAVFLRAGLIRGPRVTYARAVLTTFYEVLVTMAGGTVLAVLLLALLAPDTSAGMDWLTLRKLLSAQEPGGLIDRKVLMALGILLLVPIGIPILPPGRVQLIPDHLSVIGRNRHPHQFELIPIVHPQRPLKAVAG